MTTTLKPIEHSCLYSVMIQASIVCLAVLIAVRYVLATRFVVPWILAEDHCLNTDDKLEKCAPLGIPGLSCPSAKEAETDFSIRVQIGIEVNLGRWVSNYL